MWSWVISTSHPGSKESSTGLVGRRINALNNNRDYIEEKDQLTDHSKALPAETLLHAMMLCPPASFCPQTSQVKFMNACNNNHVLRLIYGT